MLEKRQIAGEIDELETFQCEDLAESCLTSWV